MISKNIRSLLLFFFIATIQAELLQDYGNGNSGAGPNNTVDGQNNTYIGQDNKIKGSTNLVIGDTNNIKGNGNIVQGTGNKIGMTAYEKKAFEDSMAASFGNMMKNMDNMFAGKLAPKKPEPQVQSKPTPSKQEVPAKKEEGIPEKQPDVTEKKQTAPQVSNEKAKQEQKTSSLTTNVDTSNSSPEAKPNAEVNSSSNIAQKNTSNSTIPKPEVTNSLLIKDSTITQPQTPSVPQPVQRQQPLPTIPQKINLPAQADQVILLPTARLLLSQDLSLPKQFLHHLCSTKHENTSTFIEE